ncbi:MAG TPA: general stress protein, partial [Planococcus sp. (in: firmicutes)]|nr:general stress protein [Planococcus sp. (in: firmicutes)]
MADNKFMGTFDSETEVLRKIEEMKAQGAAESDMYVMANDEDQISMVRGRTDVDYKSSEGNWMDKFMGFLSGNDSVRQAFSGMGVDEEEADRYYQEVQNGKILLFVDKEYGANYKGDAPYDNDAYSDPSSAKGATGVAGASSATGTAGVRGSTNEGLTDHSEVDRNRHADTGAVAQDGLTVDTNESNDVAFNTEHNKFGENETAGVGKDSGTG